jgi:hypothetical protein
MHAQPMVIWNILRPFGIFCGHYVGIFYGHLVAIWYTFPRFGKMCQEKSGNPVSLPKIFFIFVLRISQFEKNGVFNQVFDLAESF